MKRCFRCKKFKSEKDFCKVKSLKNELNYECKECANTRQKEYRLTSRSKSWRKRYNKTETSKQSRSRSVRKALYKITEHQFREMLTIQQGVCAICKGSEQRIHHSSKKRFELSIDHCHKTGKIRALLCFNCNLALGKMKDNPKLLRKAAKYVEKYNQLFQRRSK